MNDADIESIVASMAASLDPDDRMRSERRRWRRSPPAGRYDWTGLDP
jgi:hypothetical protein